MGKIKIAVTLQLLLPVYKFPIIIFNISKYDSYDEQHSRENSQFCFNI